MNSSQPLPTFEAQNRAPDDKSPAPDVSHADQANAIRFLAMDAVERANSGHPGMPMGMADVATVLWTRYLKFDPHWPEWPDRDRFVLSAGHGSMLLYALAYLTGYPKMTLEQIKNFRQLGSLTDGHPEVDIEAGIETTTGPLGQGLGNAVGMALAERILNARFGADLVDHCTYVIASDGDLMEGISHESCALAGHLGLSRLIVFYDSNGISIDGSTSLSFSDNTALRFEAYGWHVQEIDGHDPQAIAQATEAARENNTAPSLIICRTHIGYGSPNKQDSAASHGAALGPEEIEATRKQLGWPYPPFEIPDPILQSWRQAGARGAQDSQAWKNRFETAAKPLQEDFEAWHNGPDEPALTDKVHELKESFVSSGKSMATRKASGAVLEELQDLIPNLIGGSADLTGSNNTKTKKAPVIHKENYGGQYVHYGVREHGMAAAMNGMALHNGVIPYGGTFLTFSDYCRPAIRMAALMETPSLFVMTHDSIGLGEDGPTHQPVEHLAALRAIPNVHVFRPCDPVETAEAWECALLRRNGPSVLTLTRQNVPLLREASRENMSVRGGYILKDASQRNPSVVLIATGSEVEIAIDVQRELENVQVPTRVVSVPCFELFQRSEKEYRDSVLGDPSNVLRAGIEAASSQGWRKILGENGLFFGMNGFGASGPYEALYEHFGLTPSKIKTKILETIKS